MITSLLALVIISAPPDLDPALSQMIESLEANGELSSDPGEDIAVWVGSDPAEAQPDLCRIIRGLLVTKLEQRGHKAVLSLTEADDDEDEAARRRGAEWLLSVRVQSPRADELSLYAELRSVDRGLWHTPPRPARSDVRALSEARARAPTGLPSGKNRPEPGDAKVVGEIRRFGDRVLSMASCGRTPDAAERLVVLGAQSLEVYSLETSGAERAWSLSLDSLPPSPIGSRDPIGRVVCADLDGDSSPEIAFGSSLLAKGYVLSRREPSGDHVIVRELEGIPIGRAGAKLLLARVEPGTNRWRLEDRAPPYLDLQAVDGRILALGTDFRWSMLGTKDRPLPRTTGGVGGTLVVGDAEPILVTTSSLSWSGPDRLRFIDSHSGASLAPEIPMPGPVRASTALARSAEGSVRLAVAVRAPRDSESQIYLVRGPRGTAPP